MTPCKIIYKFKKSIFSEKNKKKFPAQIPLNSISKASKYNLRFDNLKYIWYTLVSIF